MHTVAHGIRGELLVLAGEEDDPRADAHGGEDEQADAGGGRGGLIRELQCDTGGDGGGGDDDEGVGSPHGLRIRSAHALSVDSV